jgi:isopropylmalate/homocitrate/citramalate synthase
MMPRSVRIVEVGPRDGLQNEKETIDTGAKVEFIDLLGRSGLAEIEVTSFVSPAAIPQLADAPEVLTRIELRPEVRYPVLIPNLKGLERWLEIAQSLAVPNRAVSLFTAASETFNKKNTNAGLEESIENFALVMGRLEDASQSMQAGEGIRRPFVRAYISTAFVCPYEGEVAPDRVACLASELLDLGVDELSIGDTIGAATPAQVVPLIERLLPVVGRERLAMHFHDTRGTALANVLAALGMGISIFDSSAGGLGGCPYAPGAAGNLATEDLVYLLDGMGIETGVRLEDIVRASQFIRGSIGHPLPSKEFQAFQAAGF